MRYGKPKCTADKKGHHSDSFAGLHCPACSPHSSAQEGAITRNAARPPSPSVRFHEATDLPINQRKKAIGQSHNIGQQEVIIPQNPRKETWNGTWFEDCTFISQKPGHNVDFAHASVGVKNCAVDNALSMEFTEGSEVDGLTDFERGKSFGLSELLLTDYARGRNIRTSRIVQVSGKATLADSRCGVLELHEGSYVTVTGGVYAERFIYIRRGFSGHQPHDPARRRLSLVIDQPGQLVLLEDGVDETLLDIRVPTMVARVKPLPRWGELRFDASRSSRPEEGQLGLDYYEAWRDVARRPEDGSEGVFISADNEAAREWALNAGVVENLIRQRDGTWVLEGSESDTDSHWSSLRRSTLNESVLRVAAQVRENPA